MLEGDLPEVANKYRCLELFQESIDNFVSKLPLSDVDKPVIRYFPRNNNSGRAILGIYIEIPSIDKLRYLGIFECFKNTAFGLNASIGIYDYTRPGSKKYVALGTVEFNSLPQSDETRARIFKEKFEDYLSDISLVLDLPIDTEYSYAIDSPCDYTPGYLVKGKVLFDVGIELFDGTLTVPNYENEIDRIISDLRILSNSIGGKFTTSYSYLEGATTVEFEVLFGSSRVPMLYN